MSPKQIEKLIEGLNILVVDQNLHTRKLTRLMLMNIGAKSFYEAADGIAALDIIRTTKFVPQTPTSRPGLGDAVSERP